jgi:hypothetical protein
VLAEAFLRYPQPPTIYQDLKAAVKPCTHVGHSLTKHD